MNFVAVTTCMGRLEHLKRTLPLMVEHLQMPIVVVDYACPDGTADWVEAQQLPNVLAFRAEPQALLRTGTDGKPLFWKTQALNLGACEAAWESARHSGLDYLVFVDADTIVSAEAGRWIRENAANDRFLISQTLKPRCDLVGFLVVPSYAFRAVGGFDESFMDWGAEDLDMRLRLFLDARLRFSEMPPEYLDWIRHSDEDRAAHYGESNIMETHQINAKLMVQNALRSCPGMTVDQIFGHPSIVRLMGGTVRVVP